MIAGKEYFMVSKEKNWIITDDDSVQYRREVTELENSQCKVFELYQVQAVEDMTKSMEENPTIFAIAHDFVYMSEIDIQGTLECYGYDSVEQMKTQYGEDWEGILAECQFELDAGCFENLSQRMPLMTWTDAKKVIEKLVGEE